MSEVSRYSRQTILSEVGTGGQQRLLRSAVAIMAIVPQRTPCFRCLLTRIPMPGSTATCDTVGVFGPAVNVIASLLEVTEGLKILMGKDEEIHGQLLYVDVWSGFVERLELGKENGRCPTCERGQFEFLEAKVGTYSARLCGRNTVQVSV